MNTALITLLEETGAIKRIQQLPDAATQLTDKDYWGSVGILSLTGLLVVFLILATLIFFFWLIGVIFKSIDKSKAEKKAESAKAEKPEAPAPAEAVESAPADNDEELVAVISAAIAAYEGEGGFTIRSIKRRGENTRKVSAWRAAGIRDGMNQF